MGYGLCYDVPTSGERGTTVQITDYMLSAETRAVEEGHHAFADGEGRWRVKSDTEPGITWNVYRCADVGGLLVLDCTCPSGTHRTGIPVPCKHAALVARRLVREGQAEWSRGWFWSLRPAPTYEGPADPFEGL
jgi:hypothetical protein